MKLSLMFAALVVSTGCAQSAPRVDKGAPVATGFDVISLDRSQCFGECPNYSVKVHSDGKAQFIGKKFVKVIGRRDSKIAPESLAVLTAAVRMVNLDSMRPHYVSQEDGCVSYFTDHPSITITIKHGYKAKTVTLDLGCSGPDVPSDALLRLAQSIDQVSNTRPLIAK